MKRRTLLTISFTITALIGGMMFWNYDVNSASAQDKTELFATPTEWNAANEFSLTQGGTTGVWGYGHSVSGVDDTFVVATQGVNVFPCGFAFGNWTNPAVEVDTPAIGRNPGNTFYCAGYSAWTPDILSIHPGHHSLGAKRAVLRWTAPSAGTFLVNGSFLRHSPTATTDVKILKNVATTLFSGNLNNGSYDQPFSFSVTVAAADTLDFSIGSGGDGYFGDATALALTIGAPVTACQAAPGDLHVSVPAENSPSDVKSGNTNAKLVGDATYTNFGKVGRAFSFDGAGDYVRIEDNAAQKPADQLTLEGWFKFNATGGIIQLAGKPLRGTFTNSYALYTENGQLSGLVGNTTQYTRVKSAFNPAVGVWYHLAFTYEFAAGVSTLKLFANGVEVTNAVDGTLNLPLFYDANPYPFMIGADFENDVPSFPLNGLADEVALYNRALTQAELFSLTKQGSFGKCPPPNCAQPPSNQVSWYQGEANALDSRSNNHGALFNGTTFQTAKVGQGFKFDGIDDRVEIPDSPSLKPQNLTVETWVKFDSLSSNTSGGAPSGYQYLVFKKNTRTSNFEGYTLVKNADNTLTFGMANAGGTGFYVTTTGFTVMTGVYYHIVGTFDGMFSRIYVNGALLGTTGGFSFTPDYDTRPVFLGTSGEAFDGKLNGVLDETSIYNRALSDSEIQQIYNAGQSGKCKPIATNPAANQIAWYSGDGDTRDFTGLNPNGTNNGATFTVGKVGQAFSFNGSSNVEVVSAAQLNPSQITIETWVYKTTNGDADLVGKDGETGERQYWLGAASNARFRPHLSTTNNGLVFFDGATAYILNEWYHVAMTYDGANLRLYVNGVLDGSTAATGSIISTTQPLRIGGGAPTGQLQNYLTGRLDEVSLYSRALSPSEIAAVYNAGVAGKLKSAATPINLTRTAKTETSFAPTTVQLSSATVTFAQVATAGTTSQNNIDLALLPKLPASLTFTGLAYDISTTAGYQNGSADDVQVCFKLPALSNVNIANLRVFHLEGGAWIDRTALGNTFSNFCTDNLTSLSPFAIVEALAPTAANVSVGGRALTTNGSGIRNAIVTLTDMRGISRTAYSNSFGWFTFDEIAAGETYIISIFSKRSVFSQNTQVLQIMAATDEIRFTADDD